MNTPRRRIGGAAEAGASLTMALALLSLLGIFAVLLLGYVQAGLRQGVAIQDQRAVAYSADGTMDGAINALRPTLDSGRDATLGGRCPAFEARNLNATTVTVTCTGRPGSGRVVPGVNAPRHAVLALGSGMPGVTTAGSGTFAIRGAVATHGAIDVAGPTRLDAATAPVRAVGTCDPTKITGDPVTCSTPADALMGDPAYPSPIASLPAYRAVPSCPGPNQVVALDPGYYDDAGALSVLTSPFCPGTLVWLRPGAYYFDFDLQPNRPGVWTVADPAAVVVGGTPKGWTPTGRPPVVVPGGCATETDPAPNAGVQLVFGGGSRLHVEQGAVELCPTPSRTTQQLTLVGRTTGAAPAARRTTSRAANAGGVPGVASFTAPQSARRIGERPTPRTADAALPPSVFPASVAAMQLTGFSGLNLPAGTAVLGASLRIGHVEHADRGIVVPQPGSVLLPPGGPPRPPPSEPPDSGAIPPGPGPGPGGVDPAPGGATIEPVPGDATVPAASGTMRLVVTVTPGSGTPPCVVQVPAATGFRIDAAAVTPCLDTPAERSGLQVRVDASAAATRAITLQLDGVELELLTVAPALRAQSGCVTDAGFGGCAWVSTGPAGRLVSHGTVYAPGARVALDLGGGTGTVLGRGAVVRALGVTGVGTPDPAGTVRLDAYREVELVARTGAQRRLRALLRLDDGPEPGRRVTVQEWSVLR